MVAELSSRDIIAHQPTTAAIPVRFSNACSEIAEIFQELNYFVAYKGESDNRDTSDAREISK